MRRGLARPLLTALLAVLVAPLLGTAGALAPAYGAPEVTPAPPAGTLTFTGHGYGHGHGMSQYGAQGAATGAATGQALTWEQIVGFYYPGTALADYARSVRVLISADTTRDVLVAPRAGLIVVDTGTGAQRALPANGATKWRLGVTRTGRSVVAFHRGGRWHRWWVLSGDGAFEAGGQPIRLLYAGTSHNFRGRLLAARPAAGSHDRDTVNQLGLEDYLLGVVPREMPPTWSPHAVRAQAVAARTYAAYLMRYPAGRHYDICDTTSCQVYGGYDAEHPGSNAAVAATAGKVLTSGGAPIFAQFASSSGGWTDSNQFSYLPDQADPYDAHAGNPVHTWQVAIDVARLEAAFPAVGDLTGVEIVSRDGHGDWGGRVVNVRLLGTKNGVATAVPTTGNTLRSKLGLRSNWFVVQPGAARTA